MIQAVKNVLLLLGIFGLVYYLVFKVGIPLYERTQVIVPAKNAVNSCEKDQDCIMFSYEGCGCGQTVAVNRNSYKEAVAEAYPGSKTLRSDCKNSFHCGISSSYPKSTYCVQNTCAIYYGSSF